MYISSSFSGTDGYIALVRELGPALVLEVARSGERLRMVKMFVERS